jgi:hypothetical protein
LSKTNSKDGSRSTSSRIADADADADAIEQPTND